MIISIVLSGDYEGKLIKTAKEGAYIEIDKKNILMLNSDSVCSYEIIESNEDKKFSSTLKRGVAGSFLAGGIGAIAGMATTKGEMSYKIKILFYDGKTSLIQADKAVYDKIVFHCLNTGSATPNAIIYTNNRFCSNCGDPITGAAKFCSSCGFSVEATTTSSSVVAHSPVSATNTPTFSCNVAQNIIVHKGNKYDLDSIYSECKGKPIKFSMRMMKEAKNAKMSKEETKQFLDTVDLFFKPKLSGQTPNIGVITII